jgi:hypothetical protein
MNNTEIMLSKWWKTKSAKAAFRRVAKQKKQWAKKMRIARLARREFLRG